MTPTVIEDYEIPIDGVRIVVGPPDGDPTGTIRPVEAIVVEDCGTPVFVIKIALDKGDLERLEEKPYFWLSMVGHQLQPFDVFVS
jgi:hypothetical protein